ncbi:MAG: thiamine phosphate synthase [Gemmatimonadales bacterium]|nr:thiamine phosphate synthase [Gemmatimonadales bacterium]
MRPLPRLHAVTNDVICRGADFGIQAAAIAAAGSGVAVHARAPGSTAAQLTVFAGRILALARPAEAAVVVSARPDLAQGLGAQGVQLRAGDLTVADARRVFPSGWIGRSAHSDAEAEAAVAEGADYLLVGTIYPSASHPDQAAAGPDLGARTAALGRPVIAIGGMTPERAREARSAGAWGVAAISALWLVRDPHRAAVEMLEAGGG